MEDCPGCWKIASGGEVLQVVKVCPDGGGVLPSDGGVPCVMEEGPQWWRAALDGKGLPQVVE